MQNFIVVILGHGINKDRVDERKADDATKEHEYREVYTGKESPTTAGIAGDGIGKLVPTLDSEQTENAVYADGWIAKILGCYGTKDGRRKDSEDDEEHDEGDEHQQRCTRGKLKTSQKLVDVGNESQHFQALEQAHRTESKYCIGGHGLLEYG